MYFRLALVIRLSAADMSLMWISSLVAAVKRASSGSPPAWLVRRLYRVWRFLFRKIPGTS